MAGKKCEKHVAEFGERVGALRPKSKGAHKWDYIWYEGVRVGVVSESGEKIIITPEGATRSPQVRRRPEG